MAAPGSGGSRCPQQRWQLVMAAPGSSGSGCPGQRWPWLPLAAMAVAAPGSDGHGCAQQRWPWLCPVALSDLLPVGPPLPPLPGAAAAKHSHCHRFQARPLPPLPGAAIATATGGSHCHRHSSVALAPGQAPAPAPASPPPLGPLSFVNSVTDKLTGAVSLSAAVFSSVLTASCLPSETDVVSWAAAVLRGWAAAVLRGWVARQPGWKPSAVGP
jgi:hypothetical protein